MCVSYHHSSFYLFAFLHLDHIGHLDLLLKIRKALAANRGEKRTPLKELGKQTTNLADYLMDKTWAPCPKSNYPHMGFYSLEEGRISKGVVGIQRVIGQIARPLKTETGSSPCSSDNS